MKIPEGNRRETDEAAVACAARVGDWAGWHASVDETVDGGEGGAADVDAVALARKRTMKVPVREPGHELSGFEAFRLQECIREAEGRGSVVCPLAWTNLEGSAADHLRMSAEWIDRRELQSGAKSIADGEAE
jgi:hypothetical protein